MRINPRYYAPLLITLVLLVGQLGYGILESYAKTLLAIASAIAAEVALSRLLRGRWPGLASAYITGISVGILVRSSLAWPYALDSVVSILSKYVLRLRDRHLWNPSNFGIVAMLLFNPNGVAVLSFQWGNSIWPMALIWTFGIAILGKLGRLHISFTYVLAFLALAALRARLTGIPLAAAVGPITGPMYQLFIFFMITDPKTTVRTRRGQCLVAFLVAVAEMLLRLNQAIYAPFYALFMVGPAALGVEMLLDKRAAGMKIREKAIKFPDLRKAAGPVPESGSD